DEEPDSTYQTMCKIYEEQFHCSTDQLTKEDLRKFVKAAVKIKTADIIYVGDGNALRLMSLLRKYKIDVLLRDAFHSRTVLCGVNAGAICWCSCGNSDSRKFTSGSDQLIRVNGLGLIPLLLCPHYDVEPARQADLKRMMKSTHNIPAIAMDKGTALEIKDGCYRILRSLENAEAKKCYWKSGEYRMEVLPIQDQFEKVAPLFAK
ncbi:MAG TPA: Type 1 glutamine amidotransferase-like domain-containing protein, partial [Clostridia bacterium]|nr:Type 1 glutamine amidotransferase-like domain-containing protein [Clostridia bacterium]